MNKNETLKTQKEVINQLSIDGKEIKPNYFSKLVKEGKLPYHTRRGSPKKFYYYSEIKPHFIKNSPSEENNDIPTEIKTKENVDELNKLLTEAQTAVQKVQIVKDFWTGKLNQHKYEVEKGRYYLKSEIDKKAEYLVVSVKNKLLGLPSKISPQLVGVEEITEIEQKLYDFIYEILQELSNVKELV